ncbi:MAG: hypothetical protein ACRD4Q_00065 [Candidatus Acidiferrales bacterium]
MLSWLGGLFGSFLNIFKPLAQIAHWKIWAAIWDLIQRLRNWYKWYQQNVQKRMQAMRALYNQYFNQFVAPILKIVDTVRRLTGIIGLFNHALATKLNTMFERVEGYILLPFNLVIQRINQMQRMFGGFLTPLGYLDRATLVNSFWRDLVGLKSIWSNPFNTTFTDSPVPPPQPINTSVSDISQTVQGKQTDISSDVSSNVSSVKQYIGLEV